MIVCAPVKRKSPSDDKPLNEVVKQAVKYAEQSMKSIGHVPPTLLAQTPDGLIIHTPREMEDERHKNNFANTARMIAVAHDATAVAVILESWMTSAREGKPLDPSIPPAESPDRDECVVIQAEANGAAKTKFLSIQRNSNRKFTGFSCDHPDLNKDEMQGRFVGILPPKQASLENKKMAKQVLMVMGIVTDNKGFNPMWN